MIVWFRPRRGSAELLFYSIISDFDYAVKVMTPKYDAQLLAQRAAERLRALADDLARVSLPAPHGRVVSVDEICNLYEGVTRKVQLREWNLPKKNEQVIYRLSVSDNHTLRRFDQQRDRIIPEQKNKMSLARFNKFQLHSNTLYVGASQDLSVRLEWHFGIKRPENFALHLSRWLPAEMRQIPITLEYWPLSALSLAHDLAAQALEDAMWSECAPLFGRQGAK